MTEKGREEFVRALSERFGDRLKLRSAAGSALLVSVWPGGSDDVRYLARLAREYGVPLAPRGAGLSLADDPAEGIVIRFDLMRNTRIPEGDEDWAEAEPGALWLTLDNELRLRGRGLAVYPTSAPRATVGGWLATDGVGVGSFRYGRLRQNVPSVDVVMPGGELREVPGERLGEILGSEDGSSGIIVRARLRTRRADADVPFAVAFDEAGPALEAAAGALEEDLPLWHLVLINPRMSEARELGGAYLLFGAYQAPCEEVEAWLASLARRGGRVLGASEAHRVWGERFFPAAPASPVPSVIREFVPLPRLEEKLPQREEHPYQVTFSRSGEVLLLALQSHRSSRGRTHYA